MGFYEFNMSCGHKAKREVAEPSKYYNIDRRYYTKQGLCDDCWKELHKKHRQAQEGKYAKTLLANTD